MRNPKAKILLLMTLLFPLAFFSGCAKNGLIDEKDVIAYVNKEPIFTSELKREIALKARQDPSFKVTPESEAQHLELMIQRKLVIQRAMEKGLAREERFVNTIRSFWEQTLIRDYLDYKKRGFQDYVFVADDEIKRYYEELVKNKGEASVEPLESLRPEIESWLARQKEAALFEEWLANERANARIKILKR